MLPFIWLYGDIAFNCLLTSLTSIHFKKGHFFYFLLMNSWFGAIFPGTHKDSMDIRFTNVFSYLCTLAERNRVYVIYSRSERPCDNTQNRRPFSTSILMRNLSVPLSINCTSEQGGQNCFNEFILTPASFQAHRLKYTNFLSLGQSISHES